MESSRFLPLRSIVAPTVAILALAGLSACDGAKDPAATAAAASQAAAPTSQASAQGDDAKEADGTMQDKTSGGRGADVQMGGPQGRMPENHKSMGGSNMTMPMDKPSANPDTPIKDDSMPMKDRM